MKKRTLVSGIMAGLTAFMITACSGLQVNLPIKVQTMEPEDVALGVSLRNQSKYRIKVQHPIVTGFLGTNQEVIFRAPQPGNHQVVISIFDHDRQRTDEYVLVTTMDIPYFLNGQNIVRANGRLVGHQIEITDGMIRAKIFSKK